MPTGFKDQIAADLQKAKQVGGTKVEKIRKIFQDALSQTVTELKEGSSEIRIIAQESTSTIFDTLKETPSQPTSPTPVEIKIVNADESKPIEVTPMEPTIRPNHPESNYPESSPSESNAEIRVDSIADSTSDLTAEPTIETIATPHPVVAEPTVEVQPEVLLDTETTSTNSAGTTAQHLVETLKVLLDRAMNQFKQQEIYADIQQQMAKLKEQLEGIDSNLTSRYGDRYTHFKQDIQQDAQKAKVWYEQTRADAAEKGSYWVDEKQAEINAKAGKTGATIAQKEQKIKQLLKELWQTVRQ